MAALSPSAAAEAKPEGTSAGEAVDERGSAAAGAALLARGLGKTVAGPGGALEILCDVDLRIASGEAVAIVGRSGSGKSTLLGLLAGLDEASSGGVELLGQSLGDLDEDGRARLRAGRVGFVFQSFQLLPGLTALENVLLPLELAAAEGHWRGELRPRAAQMLDAVGLAERAAHYPAQLSGGEQQRVALARAFATDPQVLFADEPTGNLDEATGASVIEQLFALREAQGATLVLVTHDPALATRCDRRLEMHAGRLREMS